MTCFQFLDDAGVSCGDPEVPNAGYVSKSGTDFENVALISCLKGYSMAEDDDGKVLQSCNAIGEWIPRVKPVCKGTPVFFCFLLVQLYCKCFT